MTGKEAEDNTEQHQQLHVALLNEENAHQCCSLFVFCLCCKSEIS